jgi:hypothetical protein
MLLSIEAPVDRLERAFGITLREYSHPTEARAFFAPDSDPVLPKGLAVRHVSGLNNYRRARPRNLRESSGAQPKGGTGQGGTFLGKDFRAAYIPGSKLTGAGQIVGLFELDGYYASDITAYENVAVLPNVPIENVLIDGFSGTPAGRRPGSGNEEVSLDIEMAISMAPGLAKVLVYEASPTSSTANIDDLLNRIATDNLAQQISCSWGFDIDPTMQQIFQELAAQGQSFYEASGDDGAFEGAVFQPSDDPFFTVVGGTTLNTDSNGNWVSEDSWTGSGGGISTVYPIPDWQAGIDMSLNGGSPSMRNLPDVAMVADNVLATVDRGRSLVFSGTSIAAPLWAAFTALVNEQGAATGKPRVGFVNPALYAIGRGSRYSGALHDITAGDNSAYGSVDGYSAVRGYDLCTGWGTPNGTGLIEALLAPPLDELEVTPPAGFTAEEVSGGDPSVSSRIYSLRNSGSNPLEWTTANPASWLDVTPSDGNLAPGETASVTVRLNDNITNYLAGDLSATVAFTNMNSGAGQTRRFEVIIGNAGFETGDFTDWKLSGSSFYNYVNSIDASYYSGGTALSGIDDSAFAHSGIYGAFFGQTKSVATLTQTLATQTGQQYLLSFWISNPVAATPNEFRVRWNGITLFDQSNMPSFGWTNMQFTVSATGESTALQFGLRNDLKAFALDDISVQFIPTARIQNVTATDGTITLSWTGVSGQAYQVQYSDNLDSGQWLPLGGPVTSNSGTFSVSDSVAASAHRFYRIVLLQ